MTGVQTCALPISTIVYKPSRKTHKRRNLYQFFANPSGLVHVVRRCPSIPQFLHLPGFRGFFGISPLSGHVVFLCPSHRHMLQNLVLLLSPSYGAFSLLFVGLPGPRRFSGAVRHCMAFVLNEFPALAQWSASRSAFSCSPLADILTSVIGITRSSKASPSRFSGKGAAL